MLVYGRTTAPAPYFKKHGQCPAIHAFVASIKAAIIWALVLRRVRQAPKPVLILAAAKIWILLK